VNESMGVNVKAKRRVRFLASVISPLVSMALIIPFNAPVFASDAQGEGATLITDSQEEGHSGTPTPALASDTKKSPFQPIPLPKASQDKPGTLTNPNPTPSIRLVEADPPSGGGGGGGGEDKGPIDVGPPPPPPPPVISWVWVGRGTRNHSGLATWGDIPQQYNGYPNTVQRSNTPSGLPFTNHNYNPSNVCRFSYVGGASDPWARQYARGVWWSGWYGVNIYEMTIDGRFTGSRSESWDGTGFATMGGCHYAGEPNTTRVVCAVTVGPITIEGPGPIRGSVEDPGDNEARLGDYGRRGSSRPAYSGRNPTEHHPRPSEPVVALNPNSAEWSLTPAQARLNGAPDIVAGMRLAGIQNKWGPGLYNPRTVPRVPWRVREGNRDWVYRGQFGDAFITRGRNLFGLGTNSNSLSAFDSCVGAQVNFPASARQGLYGYGIYDVDIDRVTTECTVHTFWTFGGIRVFAGCTPSRQDNIVDLWIISNCQGRMGLFHNTLFPNDNRFANEDNFDPSRCVSRDGGYAAKANGGGQGVCTWPNPQNLGIPYFTSSSSAQLAVGTTHPVAQSDGRHWTVRYDRPTRVQVYPVSGPEYNPPLSARESRVRLLSGEANRWLIWNVSMASTPWILSKTQKMGDGSRAHGNTNPNVIQQPFGTLIAGQYNKLKRFGTGVTQAKLDRNAGLLEEDGNLRSLGTTNAKDIGESETSWSNQRLRMNIWFNQPGSFPSGIDELQKAEFCRESPGVGVCSGGKRFGTRLRFFQMFEATLIEGAFIGLRSPAGTGDLRRPVFDQSDTPQNQFRHVVAVECRTNWNYLQVVGSRTSLVAQ